MILDTNALSALAEKNASLIDLLAGAGRLTVTFVTLGEFSYGVRNSRARNELEEWMRKNLLSRLEILFPDLSTIEHYADVRTELRTAGTPIPANDIWIAALVRQHQLPIISSDQHFDNVTGLERLEW